MFAERVRGNGYFFSVVKLKEIKLLQLIAARENNAMNRFELKKWFIVCLLSYGRTGEV